MTNANKTIRVLAAGTFDYFHKGHQYYLQEAKKLGDELYVIIARDQTVFKLRGIYPANSEDERLKAVKKSEISDKIFLGELKDKFKLVKKIQPDIIAVGYDQIVPKKKIWSYLPHTKFITINSYYPKKYKSSVIRKSLN